MAGPGPVFPDECLVDFNVWGPISQNLMHHEDRQTWYYNAKFNINAPKSMKNIQKIPLNRYRQFPLRQCSLHLDVRSPLEIFQ